MDKQNIKKTIVKTISFENVTEDYGYDMDLEYVDFGDGQLHKQYWLADNFNHVKVSVWVGGNPDDSYEEEEKHIKEDIKKNIKGYAAALEAAAEIINNDDYFDNNEEEEDDEE